MNERELIAETIATVKRDGWIIGWLSSPSHRHCILGAVGRARWGAQWDIDCHAERQEENLYSRLSRDPVTNSVVNHIYDVIRGKGVGLSADGLHAGVIVWNDNDASEEEILEVLEKVQAEIG